MQERFRPRKRCNTPNPKPLPYWEAVHGVFNVPCRSQGVVPKFNSRETNPLKIYPREVRGPPKHSPTPRPPSSSPISKSSTLSSSSSLSFNPLPKARQSDILPFSNLVGFHPSQCLTPVTSIMPLVSPICLIKGTRLLRRGILIFCIPLQL